MLSWIFGEPVSSTVHLNSPDTAGGFLQLKRARVKWFMSLDYNTIPEEVKNRGQRTYRLITVNGEELEFSEGFTDLHTESYKKILVNEGFSLSDAFNSIQIAYDIRNKQVSPLISDYHYMLKNLNK